MLCYTKKSFHPQHTFRGVVKSQFLRFHRICTRKEHFREAEETLFKALRKRGYGRTFLRRCLRTFQERKERENRSLLPLITTFSSTSKLLNHKLKGSFDRFVVQEGLLPKFRVVSAFRRNRNLADSLVQATLPPLILERPLKLELKFVQLKFMKNDKDRTIVRIQQAFSLRSKNCVHVIFCKKCGLKYVGETKNNLSTRLIQHVYNVRNRKEMDTPFFQHFLHHGLISLRIAGLQREGKIKYTRYVKGKVKDGSKVIGRDLN